MSLSHEADCSFEICYKSCTILFSQPFGSSTPEDHADYVWDNFVTKAKAARIAIVAHSYGGVVTSHLVGDKLNAKYT